MKFYILFIGLFISLCRGQQRIAGGQASTVNAHPYATALLTNNGVGSTFSYACGGTIIRNDAILSAASCFFTGTTAHAVNLWRARVGSSFSNAGGTIHILNRITTHPNFQLNTLDSNIAVLRTRFNIDLVPGEVEQAFLPGTGYTFSTNQVVHAIGWGANVAGSWSEQLQETQIWTGDQQVCTNRYQAIGITVTTNMVCAGWLDVGIRGQCEGDVGNPLINNGVVVGLFSHASGCADFWFLGINTRVPPFTSWIVATAIAS